MKFDVNLRNMEVELILIIMLDAITHYINLSTYLLIILLFYHNRF